MHQLVIMIVMNLVLIKFQLSFNFCTTRPLRETFKSDLGNAWRHQLSKMIVMNLVTSKVTTKLQLQSVAKFIRAWLLSYL